MFQYLQDGIDSLSIYLKRTIHSSIDIYGQPMMRRICYVSSMVLTSKHIMGSSTLSIVSVEE